MHVEYICTRLHVLKCIIHPRFAFITCLLTLHDVGITMEVQVLFANIFPFYIHHKDAPSLVLEGHSARTGNRITPSYVAFTDDERLIGEAAKNQVPSPGSR